MYEIKPITEICAFQWRDRHGVFHDPKQMETRHLFFTFRMIWNHTMPEEMRTGRKHYRFPPYYTNEYMCKAIKHIGAELQTRQDLTPFYIQEINKMMQAFQRRIE